MRPTRRLVISGPGTGIGKTVVTTLLCAAARRLTVDVTPYKCGPDYIDGRHYERVAGRPARNIDLWLDGETGVQRHIASTETEGLTIVEGMMGLFDGHEFGGTSTADIARVLDAEIILVVNGWTASQTLAAVAHGLATYDSRLRFAGVIINRVAGDAHERGIRAGFAELRLPVLACIPYRPELEIPERKLGLTVTPDPQRSAAIDELAADLAAQPLLRDLLCGRGAAPIGPIEQSAQDYSTARAASVGARVRVACAKDDAFWFTYPETLEALRDAGADIVEFSPLSDPALPDDVAALWLSGGYPELYAAELERNDSMRAAIRHYITSGGVTYAECGGFMYLHDALLTDAGAFAMAGVLPGSTSMRTPKLEIGYRVATISRASPLDPAGAMVRGYEFHYAAGPSATAAPAYIFDDGTRAGFAEANLVASFLHRHFIPGDPAIARFIAAAVSRKEEAISC
jgi:cobyrinic acid a,c-diamide synthase